MNFETLKLIRAAARVERLHTMPPLHRQTVGEHTFGVLWLAHLVIKPRVMSPALVSFIMTHDVPEAITGDTPAPTIHKYGMISEGLKLADSCIIEEYELPEPALTDWEFDVFKFCDRAEFAMFALEEVADGNTKMLPRARNTIERIRSSNVHKCTPTAEALLKVLAMRCEEYPQTLGQEVTHGWPGK